MTYCGFDGHIWQRPKQDNAERLMDQTIAHNLAKVPLYIEPNFDTFG